MVMNILIIPFSYSQTRFYKITGTASHQFFNSSDSTKSQDTLKLNKSKQVAPFHMKKSPWLALLYSAIFPGAGQFYNESYWKVPILVGLSVYFGYSWFDENRQFLNYRDQYAASQTPQLQEGNPDLKTLREFYRTQRDNFTWYYIITYFVNLVDAYVDAELFDFTVKEDKYTSLGIPGRTYRLNFHLNF
jgi:hypothetical protein